MIVQREANGDLKRPISFFSKKLNGAQSRYTTTEQELLAIVETLRAFTTMLLERDIVIYTDHKNLTLERFSSDRVYRWRQFVEEFGPKLVYLPGENNVVADALSRLPRTPNPIDSIEEQHIIEESFQLEELKTCPVDLQVIAQAQKKEMPKSLYDRMPSSSLGGVNLKINHNGKVVVPYSLRQSMLEFYHENLRHPGVVKMAESILLNFTWDGLRKDCQDFVAHCEQCQRFKNKKKHYGHLPVADMRTTEPWDTVAVDLVGPWTIQAKNCVVKLQCLTIIDLATRWIEIVRVHDKSAENIALLFDRVWLCRYPRPQKVIHDQGTEFKSEFSELLDSLGIEEVTTTIKNPRANAILERTHDVFGNMLRTYDFENQWIDGKDVNWGTHKTDAMDGFISAVALAMRASHHSALGTSPGALIFGRDMFFPTKFAANWKGIHEKHNFLFDGYALEPKSKPKLKKTPTHKCEIQIRIHKSFWSKSKYPPMHPPILKALIDPGSSGSIIKGSKLPKELPIISTSADNFDTLGGVFKTNGKARVPVVLASFCDSRIVHWEFFIDDSTSDNKYDAIIGRDMLTALGIDISFKNGTLTWDELTIPINSKSKPDPPDDDVPDLAPTALAMDSTVEHCNPEEAVSDEAHSSSTSDLDLASAVPSHLPLHQQNQLQELLEKYSDLFRPGIGAMPGPPLTVEAKDPPLEPYFRKPYRIPLVYHSKVREKLDELEALGIVRKIGPNEKSSWGSPMMAVPKANQDEVRLVIDLREVNKKLRRSPHPMPRIDETFQSIDGFDWATTLDLPDAFYHIVLHKSAQKVFTFVLPWGKYCLLRMPQGYSGSPD